MWSWLPSSDLFCKRVTVENAHSQKEIDDEDEIDIVVQPLADWFSGKCRAACRY
jgi:hypothetical protein